MFEITRLRKIENKIIWIKCIPKLIQKRVVVLYNALNVLDAAY